MKIFPVIACVAVSLKCQECKPGSRGRILGHGPVAIRLLQTPGTVGPLLFFQPEKPSTDRVDCLFVSTVFREEIVLGPRVGPPIEEGSDIGMRSFGSMPKRLMVGIAPEPLRCDNVAQFADIGDGQPVIVGGVGGDSSRQRPVS